jgi:hypothetical protein
VRNRRLAHVGLGEILRGLRYMDPKLLLFMNCRAVLAIDHGLQIMNTVQKNGGLDVSSIGMSPPMGINSNVSCVPLSSRKKVEFVATLFCRPRDQVEALSVSGRFISNPRALLVSIELPARKMSSMSGMILISSADISLFGRLAVA